MPRDEEESFEETDEETEEETDEETIEETEEDEEENEDDEAMAKAKAIEMANKAGHQQSYASDWMGYGAGEEPPGDEMMEMKNDAHDAEFEVKDAQNVATPPQSTKKADAPAASMEELKDDSHDMAVDLRAEENPVVLTPTSRALKEQQLKNEAHDAEFAVTEREQHVRTPPSARREKRGGPSNVTSGLGDTDPGDESGEVLKDQAYDQAFAVDDGDSVESSEADKAEALRQAQQAATAAEHARAQEAHQQAQTMQPTHQRQIQEPSALETADDSSSEDADEGTSPKGREKGLYDPSEYDYLQDQVSKEVTDLFQFITVYKAHEVEVEPKLHPFIPEYIPAIGDIDGFIKVPPPDGKQSNLGLTVLDEPSANQSNSSVVALGLAYHAKKRVGEQSVARVEHAGNRGKVIDKWVADMQKLHASKHRAQVNYTKPMPDLETLLQLWPADFEDLLAKDLALPPAELDLDLVQYVKIVCSLLDIPCYSNLVESIHVLLSLYSEFRANPHFQGGAFSNLSIM
eukprot:TRINITY_DN13456_c0_g1_i1.p1 TRINITY_DN13456_c0_g1~~TRINITY_DN13456_c0_g1_i1.p1  ORF type:complete len:517 (+),score=226.31 TRINITY_DN13456_c0_g1_i1:86-1636(+)